MSIHSAPQRQRNKNEINITLVSSHVRVNNNILGTMVITKNISREVKFALENSLETT
jgi:hypothetical protein